MPARQGPLTARRLRIAIPALTGISLATALVAAVTLGDAGKDPVPARDGSHWTDPAYRRQESPAGSITSTTVVDREIRWVIWPRGGPRS
jgi:hypothetical protein